MLFDLPSIDQSIRTLYTFWYSGSRQITCSPYRLSGKWPLVAEALESSVGQELVIFALSVLNGLVILIGLESMAGLKILHRVQSTRSHYFSRDIDSRTERMQVVRSRVRREVHD